MIWLTICTLLLMLLGALFYASYSIGSGVYLKTVCRIDADGKAVALTYDDGPEVATTAAVLDVLKKYGAKACFFCIGQKAEQHPDLVRRMVAEGHLIGIHTYRHENVFPLFGKRRMIADLQQTKQLLEQITGEQEVTLFRPPYGVTNPTIAYATKQLRLITVGWRLRSFDTQAKTADVVLKKIKRQLKPQDIILLHDRMPFAAELTEKLLHYLSENGWKVTSIACKTR